MNLFTVTELLVGVTTFLNGLFIIITGDIRKKIHLMITLLSFATSLWGFGNAMVGFSTTPEVAMFWWKIAHIGGFYTAVFILHLVLLVTNVKRPKFLLFAYIQAALAELALVFNFFSVKMSYSFAPYYRITPKGLAYPLSLLLWIIVGTYACTLIYVHFRRSEGLQRIRYKYLWIALMCGYCGGATHLITVFYINFFPFGNFSIWFFPIMTAYAVLRHQLLDIEVIIKRTLVFAGLLASVFAMLLLPTFVIQEYILRKASFGGRALGLTISGIIIILALRRIENFLINITDKFLFQKKYDYKELLKTFTSEVLTVLDLNKLVTVTVTKLSDIIKLQSCGILLLDENKEKYNLVASQGIKEKDISLNMDNTLTTFLSRTRHYLSVKSLEGERKAPRDIVEDMNKLKLELAIPLMTLQGEMIGILTLGKKKSDEDYTQDDMDILLPLARTLAIAISNAEMFVELGKTQAEAAQREKMAVIGTLSAGINHEICNPLGIARGQCEAFLLNIKDGLYESKSQDELMQKAKQIMEKVIYETDRATSITKRLSSFAKPAKGVISEDVNIKDGIDEVLALVGYELKMDKIDIVKDVEDGLPFITADRKALEEVFFNLIRNAAQAMEERGRITVRAKKEGDKIRIEIEDTGHGIPEDKLEQIFNPFYTTKEPGKGTGLGLFIVRQVIERNGGRISVKSKVGEGTTFTLEFPVTAKERV